MKIGELKEAMATTPSGKRAEGIPFRVERSEVNIQLSFANPFWPLANNISSVYSGLLDRMRDFGVTSQALRSDAGDGSLGAFNVNFWMLQFSVSVRIRLDTVEINASFPTDVDLLERAVLALDHALRDAQPTLGYSSYSLTTSMHGRLEGTDPKQFLASFSGNAPKGLGEMVGSGTVFYFEGQPPTSLLAVSVDLSAAVAGGVFVKVHSVLDASVKPDGLRAIAEPQAEESVLALGLQVERQTEVR
jgi:hypothetical protein